MTTGRQLRKDCSGGRDLKSVVRWEYGVLFKSGETRNCVMHGIDGGNSLQTGQLPRISGCRGEVLKGSGDGEGEKREVEYVRVWCITNAWCDFNQSWYTLTCNLGGKLMQ